MNIENVYQMNILYQEHSAFQPFISGTNSQNYTKNLFSHVMLSSTYNVNELDSTMKAMTAMMKSFVSMNHCHKLNSTYIQMKKINL